MKFGRCVGEYISNKPGYWFTKKAVQSASHNKDNTYINSHNITLTTTQHTYTPPPNMSNIHFDNIWLDAEVRKISWGSVHTRSQPTNDHRGHHPGEPHRSG